MPLPTLRPRELEPMRASCRLAASVLSHVAPHVRAGVTTDELDRICHEYIVAHGAVPSPLGYRGYPKSICTSINEVVCHGIPSPRRLVDGDIINVDVTTYLGGFHGDCSKMFTVGSVSAAAEKLIRVTRESLWIGIREVGPGKHVGDIGAAIGEYAGGQHGYGIVTQFCGHGIGLKFHQAPRVSHVARRGTGELLVPGVALTIEPMINVGSPHCVILDDDWTAVTEDGELSAQEEHTVLVTEDGCEVLTLQEGEVPQLAAPAAAGEDA